jgi:two-component system OmpR family sensor kinase
VLFRSSVSNGCPVIPPERLAKLTDRFERDHSLAQGSGLGLAIVTSIMKQSGGKLSLASPVPGEASGFRAEIRFPDMLPTYMIPTRKFT